MKAKAKKQASSPLMSILQPEAVGRWMLPRLKQLTPQYIESTLSDALAGSHAAQWELFSLMEDTWPRLAKNLNEVKRAVIRLDWKVEAWAEDDEAPSDEAERRAKVVSHCLWRMRPRPGTMERGPEGMMYDLLDAWAKGLSVMEITWEARATKLGQVLAPRCVHWVAPSHYQWNDQAELRLVDGNMSREFPEHKFLIGQCQANTGNPIGAALLRPLAFWWCASNFSADWLLNYAQLFGLPTRWANYREGASSATLSAICSMLENMGTRPWAAFPEGTRLEFKEASKTGDATPQASILDRADKLCDLLVLGQTLTSDVGASGSLALGQVHSGVRADVIEAAGEWLAGVLNQQLVPAILELNYGDAEDAPEICAEPKKAEDRKSNAERDDILLKAGVAMPKAWFYERHDIPLPQEGEEVVTGPSSQLRVESGGVESPNLPGDSNQGDPTNLPQDEKNAGGGTNTPGKADGDSAGGFRRFAGTPDDGGQKGTAADGKEEAESLKAKGSGAGKSEISNLKSQIGGGAATAQDTIEEIAAQAVADGIGARRRWLAPIREEIVRLAAVARNKNLTDADVLRLVEAGRARLPELFAELDPRPLTEHLVQTLGRAAVEGGKLNE